MGKRGSNATPPSAKAQKTVENAWAGKMLASVKTFS